MSRLQAIINPVPRLNQAIEAFQYATATADPGICLPTIPTLQIAAATIQARDLTSLIAPIQKVRP
jgi:hypothetical protein